MSATLTLPKRPLGKTGFHATIFGLGGEGILRTTGRVREAVAVVEKALEVGVNYFDTAPAYEMSRDYLGQVFKGLGPERKKIFIASKTHERSKEGSLFLLDDTLKRLQVEYLDLLQLHDLRTLEDVEKIFAKGGAIEAVEEAKKQKRIRFVGITGHHDPEILLEAIRRYNFDSVLLCVNPGDSHYLPFINTVIPQARKKGMGVIAMKVLAKSYLLRPRGQMSLQEAFSYALSQDTDLAVIGCDNPDQVEQNATAAAAFQALSGPDLARLETLAKRNPYSWWFKKDAF